MCRATEVSYLKGTFRFRLKRLVESLNELTFMTFAEKKMATMSNRNSPFCERAIAVQDAFDKSDLDSLWSRSCILWYDAIVVKSRWLIYCISLKAR